jgi:hypothetical protein
MFVNHSFPKITSLRLKNALFGFIFIKILDKWTQYQNPVMNLKLKITKFCNWLQSLRLSSGLKSLDNEY